MYEVKTLKTIEVLLNQVSNKEPSWSSYLFELDLLMLYNFGYAFAWPFNIL